MPRTQERGDPARPLKVIWDSVLKEKLPDDMAQLLNKLGSVK